MSAINFRSIRFNLFILVLLIFIPLFGLIIQSAHNQKVRLHSFVMDNMLNVSRHLYEQQKFVEENTRQLLTVLSQLPELQNGDTHKTNKILHSLLEQNPIYAALLVVDLQGHLVSSGVPYVNLNVSDRKYFKDVLKTHSFSVGEFNKGRLTQKPVIHYAYPVFGHDSVMVSIIVASFDLQYYDRFLKTINLGKDANFTFVDHKGTIIFRCPNDFVSVGSKESSVILSQLKNDASEGTFNAKDKEGVNRLYGFQRISLAPDNPYMYIYAGLPEEIAFSEYRKSLSQNMLIWAIAAFFIICAAYVFSFRFIITPIDQMVKVAGLIADGNLDTKTGVNASSANELGKLALAFDAMTDKLMQRENERNNAEKELKKLKERFELAINSAKIGIWDWHLKTNSLIWDKNMIDLYGIAPDDSEFNLDNWMECIHPEDVSAVQHKIYHSIEHDLPFRSEYRIIHPLNGIKYIRIFATPLKNKEGKPARLIGVNWDITERKVWELEIKEAKEKAENNDRLKSVFFADISHEIRTPLHGMIGFAQILKDSDISVHERLQYLDIIINSGNKLLNTISNIIDISLIDAGQLKLMKKECDISEIICEIYQYYEKLRLKENKQFQLKLEIDDADPVFFMTDGFRLNQIFTNLLDNAFRSTNSGVIIMGYKIINDQICCFVKDTNIAIDNDQLQTIFDKFKSMEEIPGTSYSGNGLDLAICKGLVELMGGTIRAHNTNDKTEFYFNLPLMATEYEKTGLLQKKVIV